MPNQSYALKITCCAAALLALGSFIRPEPAQAQFGGIIGGMIGGGLRFHLGGGGGGGGGRGHREPASRHESSSEDASSDKSSSSDKSRNDRVLASLGAPPSSVQTS